MCLHPLSNYRCGHLIGHPLQLCPPAQNNHASCCLKPEQSVHEFPTPCGTDPRCVAEVQKRDDHDRHVVQRAADHATAVQRFGAEQAARRAKFESEWPTVVG